MGHLDTRRGGGENVLCTYTGKTKHGGEKQGAAKISLVGHKIAQEQVCIKKAQDRMVNCKIERDEPRSQLVSDGNLSPVRDADAPEALVT